MSPHPLPIDSVLPAIRQALAAGQDVIVEAAPGSGKTTRVPPSLLAEPWLGDRKVVLLEPRRLAARTAARYVASQLNDRVGGIVGYRMRMDTKVSARTRLEIVTEGVLSRMLQDDPSLEHVGVVVFDEFHERNLQGDLGLALTLASRDLFGTDLRVVVMSATLNSAAVSPLLREPVSIQAEGRAFPVETTYLEHSSQDRTEDLTARWIRRALAEQPKGDVLVFLPGSREIRRTAERLAGTDAVVHQLLGSSSPGAQERAVSADPEGQRKIILATDVAESSLTIENVRVVVDAGLARKPVFDPSSGLSRLTTLRVPISSADQRRGRAGRTAPGHCYRLWSRFEHGHLREAGVPEIMAADLTSLLLDVIAWGVDDPLTLRWIDPPGKDALNAAADLLKRLEALDKRSHLTPHGRDLARLGLHPRLAHMLLRGQEWGLGGLACELAALLEEGDPRSAQGSFSEADLALRVEALRRGRGQKGYDSIRRRAILLARQLPAAGGGGGPAGGGEGPAGGGGGPSTIDGDNPEAIGLLLSLAYPDRIGQQLSPGRFRLAGGQVVRTRDRDPLGDARYIVAAETGGQDHIVFRGAPISARDIEASAGHLKRSQTQVDWTEAGLRGYRIESIGAVELERVQISPSSDASADAIVAYVRGTGLHALRWSKEATGFLQRLRFLRARDESFPDVSEDGLRALAGDWLAPFLNNVRRPHELAGVDLGAALRAFAGHHRTLEIDRRAPSHLRVPSGSRITIDYSDPQTPVLAARIQELFGLEKTPLLDDGRQPVTIHLLSPARRPVQVTRDLASFWKDTYFEVRKDLRGRYPKHFWPEDPLSAPAIRGVRPR